MVYVFLSYGYFGAVYSPESWFKRTQVYAGILERLSKAHTVFNVNQINFVGKSIHNGVQNHFVNLGRNKTLFPVRLNSYVKKLRPDIVMVQGLHHPLQVIQLRLILGKRVKIIAHHHAEKPFTGIKKYIQRMASRCIDAYLFASDEIGADWVKNGNIASLHKIHEVMEVSSQFYPIEKELAKLITGVYGEPVFLWVGRLNENKDPVNMVKAFLKFAATNLGVRLYMIYHTDELLNTIKHIIENNQYREAVILVGFVPHDELLYWFNSADFFVSGSHYEGSGTAVCEAMSCGCIPVVTDIPSFRMITDKGQCGTLYEAGNETALLAALNATLTLDVQHKRTQSLNYYQSTLSFDAIACKIHQIASDLQTTVFNRHIN